MALTPQQSKQLEVLKTIERLGGSASYEKYLSKSPNPPITSVPTFPNYSPVYAEISITPLFGGGGGWCEVKLTSGSVGNCHATLEFWVDATASVSGAGGYFNHEDWDFLLKNKVNFSVEGAEHFDSAAITFSHEIGIIGKIALVGSWPLAGVKEAHGTCQWKSLLEAKSLGKGNATLKSIKQVEKLGGSAEYARYLTDTNVPEIPEYSKWPSSPCTVTSTGLPLYHNCEIGATALHVGTQIHTLFPLVPTTPNANILVRPNQKLDGQTCGWFLVPSLNRQKFILCFYVGTVGNPIAVVEGPATNVEPRNGGANEVVWVAIN